MATETRKTTTIKSVGDAFVITAGFKLQTVKNLLKYDGSKALTLFDEETKEPYFQVGIGCDNSVSKYGITFTNANKEGFAECTCYFPKAGMTEEQKKDYLKDNLALVINNINAVQEQVDFNAAALDKLIQETDAAIIMA